MVANCRAGKIDLVITKSVSRFARNLVLCISIVLDLGNLSPPVGVLYESENIFSLNKEKSMTLSFTEYTKAAQSVNYTSPGKPPKVHQELKVPAHPSGGAGRQNPVPPAHTVKNTSAGSPKPR